MFCGNGEIIVYSMSMTLRQIIQKAVKAGYSQMKTRPSAPRGYIEINEALLDPLFWKALGKATGWKIKCQNCGGEIGESTGMGKVVFKYQCKGKCGSYFDNREAEVWAKEWHRFIDHLADGGTIEGFFEGFE